MHLPILQPREHPIARRRTFAVISHPDAGKTTLTEKLLLIGGAIQLAGEVKAKRSRIHTRSDWMGIECERGISVVTSVMTFDYGGCVFNLLDTPGHADFSEDTYRTLTAVDSAIMVLDAAKGIEPRTRKLFEICRLRDIPIITFINKMDRPGRHPFELLDEIEHSLALDVAPLTWPIGSGKDFAGILNLRTAQGRKGPVEMSIHGAGVGEEISLACSAYPVFDAAKFLEGHLTPVFFGSALRDLGVHDLINGMVEFAPSPRRQKADRRDVEAREPDMTGFVFKIQANMDPNHRDRIAFVRVCSGRLTRGMRVRLVRSGKQFTVNAPQFFFAQNRALAEEAWAGDIVGIPNHGTLRIGDTLSEGEDLAFRGVPSFAPEFLRRIKLEDAMRAKKLRAALQQLAEEGVVQLFFPADGSPAIVGVVGELQLDVLAQRLQTEYGLPISYETTRYAICRWIKADSEDDLERFIAGHKSSIAYDLDRSPVFLATNPHALRYEQERWQQLKFVEVKDYQSQNEKAALAAVP